MPDIKPRKRAVQARARATVDAIKEATAHILAVNGLEGVTTNAVAERAGVSIGSLYQYYPNREAILTDLLRKKLDVLNGEMDAALKLEHFDQTVHALLASLSRSYVERPALASALVAVERLVGDDAQIAHARAALRDKLVAFLKDQDIASPELAARDITAMTRGMALAAGLAGERDHGALIKRMERAVRGYLSL